MTTAELHIVQTSRDCLKYELRVAGRRVWSNRLEDFPEDHAAVRTRMAAWALAHRVRIVERQPAELASSDRSRR